MEKNLDQKRPNIGLRHKNRDLRDFFISFRFIFFGAILEERAAFLVGSIEKDEVVNSWPLYYLHKNTDIMFFSSLKKSVLYIKLIFCTLSCQKKYR